ncbi:hypothetical protein H0B56_03100 [Haloechinothrix sp. YIM 98757]|uniref:Fe2OG dioxygenase domain-containing protein n=1 Tax=Haloechinothrix aidingensis TaxID=2752311 RepID=A0A838A7Z3_9PSEU|nr:hypothetical protein [Haloechinothrix aidingensis]MBA0124521.1 hypothetical protein [Haloechinothrix aidingensis]
MRALHPELDLGPPLRQAAWSGGVFVPHALREPFREVLVREVGDAPFEEMPDHVGAYGVRQQGGQFFVYGDDITGWPAIDRLRRELVRVVGEHGGDIGGAAAWEPNEAAAQRYRAGAGGIGVHRDGKRYRLLVAIFTVEGSAPLALCTDRDGTVAREWRTTPGSLTVLRGPGLGGTADGRPLHRVSGPAETRRISLTFRMSDRH